MKIKGRKQEILRAVNQCHRATSTRNDILKSILFDGPKLTATDLVVDVSVNIKANCIDPEKHLIPAIPLRQTLSAIRSDEVELTFGQQLVIRSLDSTFKLNTVDPSEFPRIPDTPSMLSFSCQRESLIQSLDQTTFATNAKMSNAAYNSVLIECVKNSNVVYLVATDGRRLAASKLKAQENLEKEAKTMLPASSCKQIRGILSLSKSDQVTISVDEHRAHFSCGDASAGTRLSEGRFPKWQTIFPKHEKTIQLYRNQLGAPLSAAAISTDEENPGVTFCLNDNFRLKSRLPNMGESSVLVDHPEKPPEGEFTLNPRFVNQFLGIIDRDLPFEMSFKDNQIPVMFGQGDYRYLVMPIE